MRQIKFKCIFTYILGLSLIASTFIVFGCGKGDDGLDSVPPITSGDGDVRPPPDDDDSGPPPPNSRRWTETLNAVNADKDILKGLKLPYQHKIVKKIALGESRKTKKCPDAFKKKCVKNRQVSFNFNLKELSSFDPFDTKVVDINLTGTFYSIGKNHRTELLCILQIKRCSGRSIIKLPGIGLGFLVKMIWWDKEFWADGYEKVIRSTLFHDELNNSYNEEAGLYIMEKKTFSLKDLLAYRAGLLHQVIIENDNLTFTVADDTFAEQLSLDVILQYTPLKN